MERLIDEYRRRWLEAFDKEFGVDSQRWIPVSERLPEEGIKVLVCFKGEIDSIEIREFLGGLGGVTHWMPLPEPPEVK